MEEREAASGVGESWLARGSELGSAIPEPGQALMAFLLAHPTQVSLNGNLVHQHTDWFPQFDVICKPDECAPGLLTQVSDVKQGMSQHTPCACHRPPG